MFLKKMQILLSLIAIAVHISAASVKPLDSIGRMPEITVTASRYEYQDEAWLGLVEGVVVEGKRSLESSNKDASVYLSTVITYGNSEYSLVLFTLVLVAFSVLFMSLSEYYVVKEARS